MKYLIACLILFCLIPLSPPVNAATVPCTSNCPANSPGTTSGEWPMAGGNVQRTSWNTEEVRGVLNVEWYRPIEPYIPYHIQPIAAGGKIYVATSKGLYAFNAATGAQDWVFPTGLPLGNSPTLANGILYVPSLDHKIHAITAATGQPVAGYTPYEAGAGFSANPLVINNTIYIGNRDGKFYAFDAASGAKKWEYQTGGPILFSAAYKNNVVYFAANDNVAYALDAGNGSEKWKKGGFQGAGFHSYWPVVYTEKSSGRDYVIFTGADNHRSGEGTNTYPWPAMHNIDQQYLWGSCYPDTCTEGLPWPTGTDTNTGNYWGHSVSTINVSAITNYFENVPANHLTFILDAATGTEFTFDSNGNGLPEYAPFTWSGVTNSGNKFPAVINGIDNVLYQDTIYYRMNWISRGDVVGWKWGTNLVSQVTGHHAVDEPMAYSGGGKLIYWNLCCDREAGAYDVTLPLGQANRSWNYYIYNLARNELAPGYQQMYNDGDPQQYGDMNGWQMYSGKDLSKNGVYGKHGLAQTPPIPYNGKVYFLKGNSLMAFSPTGTNPRTPLTLSPVNQGQSQITTPSTTELTQKLQTEIQKMLTAGHLRPGFHSSALYDQYGIGGYNDWREYGEIFDYFNNPADTVYTLLLAYPKLPALQTQIKAYIDNNYAPGKTYDVTRITHIGWGTGAAREPFPIPAELFQIWGTSYKSPLNPSTRPICGGCGYWNAFPPFNFYASWKLAQAFGGPDQRSLTNPYSAASLLAKMSQNGHAKPEAPPAGTNFPLIHKPYFLHLYAAGYLGYLNLLVLAGQPDDTTIRGYYNQVLSNRTSGFSKDNPYWPDTSYGGGGNGGNYTRTFAVARNFMFLTPEIAAYMKANISAATIQAAVNEYHYVAPYWFINKFEATVGEGTLDHLYNPPAMFQAKAWLLSQNREELVKYLDTPAFEKGDLFYIQNLVTALDAPTSGTQPTPTSLPNPTPTGIPGDADNDRDVDFPDLLTLLKDFGRSLTTLVDWNHNGTVDIYDFNVVIGKLL